MHLAVYLQILQISNSLNSNSVHLIRDPKLEMPCIPYNFLALYLVLQISPLMPENAHNQNETSIRVINRSSIRDVNT